MEWLIRTDNPTVIKAYAISLRVTFLSCAILAVALCLLVLPVSIPNLPDKDPRKSSNNDDAEPREGENRA